MTRFAQASRAGEGRGLVITYKGGNVASSLSGFHKVKGESMSVPEKSSIWKDDSKKARHRTGECLGLVKARTGEGISSLDFLLRPPKGKNWGTQQ